MKRKPSIAMLDVLLAVLLSTGCASRRSISLAGADALEMDPDLPEAALTQRIDAYTEYALGISAELNGHPEESLKHLLAAAKAEPARKALVVQVVGRLIQARQTTSAVDLLKRATMLPTADAELFAWLGFAYTAQGDLPAAIAANQKAIERDPTLIMGYQNLALLQQGNQHPEAALEVLNQAALQQSPAPEFLVALAELYSGHARANPTDAAYCRKCAVACLERAEALKPEDPYLLQRMADGYRQNGRVDRAEVLFLDLLEQHPGLPGVREALAEMYLMSGRKDEAAKQLEVITEERPSNERAAFFLGTIAFESGDYLEAERLFRRTVLLRPDFEPAYDDLAAVVLAQNRPADALRVIEQAQALFKESFQLEFLSAVALARLDRYDDAAQHFTTAEVLGKVNAPERLNSGFYFQFGAASERRGDFVQAEHLFRKCLSLQPDFAEALNYLGYMWAERGENMDEALRLIQRAVELEPNNAAYLDSMAWVLFKSAQAQEALGWMQKAIAFSEEPDPTLYDHLGDILAALGLKAEARQAWQQSLDLKADESIRKKFEQAGDLPPTTHK